MSIKEDRLKLSGLISWFKNGIFWKRGYRLVENGGNESLTPNNRKNDQS